MGPDKKPRTYRANSMKNFVQFKEKPEDFANYEKEKDETIESWENEIESAKKWLELNSWDPHNRQHYKRWEGNSG